MNTTTGRFLAATILAMLVAAPSLAHEKVHTESPITAQLDKAHGPDERMHERWLPEIELDWRRERERLVDMVCGLGLIALALVDCEWSAGLAEPAASPALSPATDTLDPHDVSRRPVEARMKSI